MVSDPFAPLFEIMARMDAIPPMPIFASSNIFPADHAIMFADGEQQYCLAHPMFWKRIPDDMIRSAQAVDVVSTVLPPMFGIPIHDLDHPASVEMREKVYGAMGKIIEAATQGLTAPKN